MKECDISRGRSKHTLTPPTYFQGVRTPPTPMIYTLFDARLLNGHVWPVERSAAEQHVSDESLDRRLADEADEEQLLDDLRRDGAQRRKPQQQLAETRRLARVLRAHVLLQRALRLLLNRLHVIDVRYPARVCTHTHTK